MTDDLTDLEVLAQAATPGPWEASRFFWKLGSTRGLADEFWISVEAVGDVIAAMPEEAQPSAPNAAFIAAARDAVPALIARVRKAEAERDEARAALAQVEALAKEHQSMVNPAPYTTERALIERLAALVGGDDRG